MNLQGKYALITGASRGLGREIAIAYADAGISGITLTAAPGSDETAHEITTELMATAQELESRGVRCNPQTSDVSRIGDCQNAVESHISMFSALNIVINNAGKAGRYAHFGDGSKTIADHDPKGISEIIETNLIGPYFLVHSALNYLLAADSGRIINISKRTESMHRKSWTPYGPTKAALEATTIAWAESLADTHVTVNTISPGGAVNTKFGTGQMTGKGLPPETIKPLSVWLASEDSGPFNGCRFVSDRWDSSLPSDQAALGCQEGQIFPHPERITPLKRAWIK